MKNLNEGENFFKAKNDLVLKDSELNEDNCEIVFELKPVLKSWKPGADLNALSQITKGGEYLIRAKKEVQVKGL